MRPCGFKGEAEDGSGSLAAAPLDSLASGDVEHLDLSLVVTRLEQSMATVKER